MTQPNISSQQNSKTLDLSIPNKGSLFFDHDTDLVQAQILLQIKKGAVALLNKEKTALKNDRI